MKKEATKNFDLSRRDNTLNSSNDEKEITYPCLLAMMTMQALVMMRKKRRELNMTF